MPIALRLLNPDGTPMQPMGGPVDYSLSQLVILNALDSAVIGTFGILVVTMLASPARQKKARGRLISEFDYFVTATVGLWVFAIGGAALGW